MPNLPIRRERAAGALVRDVRVEPVAAPDVIDLGNAVAAIRRQWRPLLVGVVIMLVASVAYLQLAVPQYEAAASVRIDSRRSTLPTIYSEQAERDEVFTEIEELRSHTIAAEVVDARALQLQLTSPRRTARRAVFARARTVLPNDTGEFRLVRQSASQFRVDGTTRLIAIGVPAQVKGVQIVLDSSATRFEEIKARVQPREDAVEDLRRDVDIGRAGLQASIIALRYASDDPVLARDVLNTWTANFIARRQSTQRGAATTTAAFIQAQLDTLAPQLAAAEAKLLEYRNANQIVAPEIEASTQVNQSALLQATRNELDAERGALDQALRRVNTKAATSPPDAPSPYRDLLGFPTLLRNQAASELLRSLASLDQERTALLMRRTTADPDVVTLSTRITSVEEQLRALTTTYLSGLTAQVAAADASLSTYSSKLRAIPAQEVEYARLQRAPKVYSELVGLLQTRLQEAQITEAVTDGTVRIVDEAVAPTRPSSPKPALVLALGLTGGLVLGAGLAFARERTSGAVRSRRDLQELSDTPVLGLIPTFAPRGASNRIPGTEPPRNKPLLPRRFAGMLGSPASVNELAATEAFTRLLMNLQWASDAPIRSLLITSPLPGDGKTTNALHLAESAAYQGQRVLLVDADLRCGGLSAALALSDRRGLTDYISGASTLEECTTTIASRGNVQLDAIGAGNLSHDVPIAALVKRIDELLSASSSYDLVLIDTSPINIVADAAALAPLTDGVVLVARSGGTSSAALDVALDQLHRADANVLGTVLNGATLQRSDGYGSIGEYRAYARAEA